MTDYLTRIELVPSGDADYYKLHEEMQKRGFSRKIRDKAGELFELPTGTYLIEGEWFTAQKVRALAQEAASSSHPSHTSVAITCEMSDRDFRLTPGLTPASDLIRHAAMSGRKTPG